MGDVTESEEEGPLIIDLDDEESDLFSEDEEVTEMRKKVITELTFEEWNLYSCKVCSFSSPTHVRLRNHISNKHFNSPVCICKLCGLESKNMNALCQHVSRIHRSRKIEKKKRRRVYTMRYLPSLQTAPAPPRQ